MTLDSPSPLLSINHLSVSFPIEEGTAHAVQDLSLTLNPQEVLGLVGESGCGKSLTSLAILRLVPKPGMISTGTIHFQDKDLLTLGDEAMRKIRGAEIALIPQDPLTSLNPVYTIGDQLIEILELHRGMHRAQAKKEAIALLDQVKIPNGAQRINEYPHQFSGGMRQRVMIAMALSCKPKLLIADEPTTALDVTVQAQILSLMKELQHDVGMSILLITHDLGVVAEMAHRVAVMYAGRIVEEAPVIDLFKTPQHPYTQGLLHSLPTMTRERLEPIEGHPPSVIDIPEGCAFEPRCKARMPQCIERFPARKSPTGNPHHTTHCFLY